MSSHEDKTANDEFLAWLNKKYGGHGPFAAKCGAVHDYLGMKFDFGTPGKVVIDMSNYMKSMVEEFPEELKETPAGFTPATQDLFAQGSSPLLDKRKAEAFHTFVAKGLFACKRARPDIHT